MPPKIMSSEPLLEENSELSNLSSSEIGYNTASHAGLQSDPLLPPPPAPKISHPSNHTAIGPYPIRSAPTYAQPLVSQPVPQIRQPQLATLTEKAPVAAFSRETHLTAEPRSSKAIDNLFNSFSPDSKLVASGSDDKTVQLWDLATGAVRGTLKGHTSFVQSVAFSPDGKLVASGSNDKTVRLWDSATGVARSTLEGHTSFVQSVAFSPDGKLVASGSGDTTVRLWEEK